MAQLAGRVLAEQDDTGRSGKVFGIEQRVIARIDGIFSGVDHRPGSICGLTQICVGILQPVVLPPCALEKGEAGKERVHDIPVHCIGTVTGLPYVGCSLFQVTEDVRCHLVTGISRKIEFL